MSSFYASVPILMIIGYTVLEIWHVMDVIVLHFGQLFALPPLPPPTLTAQKMKKTHGYITILHKCTKNYDYRLYCSWDMACDGWNCYFLFWAIFCPFTPLTAWKMKISKKWRKTLEISSFYTSDAKNHDHMLYCSWDMACGRCNFYFSFWDIFCPFNP